jgi:hypothetical protein
MCVAGQSPYGIFSTITMIEPQLIAPRYWRMLPAVLGVALLACSGTEDSPHTNDSLGGNASVGGTTSTDAGDASGGQGGQATVGGSAAHTSSAGGSTAEGGSSARAGASSSETTGGRPASGGTAATGGTTLTGGTKATTGGSKSNGGTKAAGGSATTGGLKATGGSPATGGASSIGGSQVSGGTSATGGNPALGGTQATGGTRATGGAAQTGGVGGASGTSCPFTGHVTYTLSKSANPTSTELNAYELITAALEKAVKYYNCYTNITKTINASYVPSVSTADGNINGSIRFGSSTTYMDYRTAMHEISHTVGIGTSSKWASCVDMTNKLYTCANGKQQSLTINGELSAPGDGVLHADNQHFWPYGINQQSEVKSEADLIYHCQMVMAMLKDLT